MSLVVESEEHGYTSYAVSQNWVGEGDRGDFEDLHLRDPIINPTVRSVLLLIHEAPVWSSELQVATELSPYRCIVTYSSVGQILYKINPSNPSGYLRPPLNFTYFYFFAQRLIFCVLYGFQGGKTTICLCIIRWLACTGCPTRYRTRLAGGPLLRVATIRLTIDTHYRHIPFHFSHNESTPVQISLQYLHW